MHRFYVSPERWNPRALALSGAEAHHARDVLRMKQGEKLVLFNGLGREITAEIVDVSDEIRLRRLHEAETLPLKCRIILGQAIPKGKNMELIVQKAVEIGAAEIAPIISDRTVVQVDSESAAQKQAKWQHVECRISDVAAVAPNAFRAAKRYCPIRSSPHRIAPARCAALEKNPRELFE